jgi:hypothetical protein
LVLFEKVAGHGKLDQDKYTAADQIIVGMHNLDVLLRHEV